MPADKPAPLSERLKEAPARHVAEFEWNGLAAEVAALEADRDRLAAELAAYKRAKQENDERYMIERDQARAELAEARKDTVADVDALAKRLSGWAGNARALALDMEKRGYFDVWPRDLWQPAVDAIATDLAAVAAELRAARSAAGEGEE